MTTMAEPTVELRGTEGGPVRRVLGVDLRPLVDAARDGTPYNVYDATVPPGVMVPLHTHQQAESFTVLAGELEFGRMTGAGPEAVAVPTGTTVHIPGGAPHSFRNAGGMPTRVLITCDAGLGRFFEDAGELTAPGTPVTPPSEADIQRVMAIMQQHGQQLLGPHPGM